MPNDQLIVERLRCQNDTEIGHITLNSPETLNSLTLNMVNEISDLLDQWEVDPKIKMILIMNFWFKKIKDEVCHSDFKRLT